MSESEFVANAAKVKLLAKLINTDSQHTLNNRFTTKRVEVLPGIYSTDIRLPLFLKDLSSKLNAKFPQSAIDESGAYIGPPIATNFDEVKTIAGSVRQPLNFGTGLQSVDISVDELTYVFDELKYLFKTTPLSDSKAKLKHKTNVGAPYWDHNQVRTLRHLSLLANNINEILELVDNLDFKQLFSKYRLLFLNHVQIRLQNDKWIDGRPKSRPIFKFSDSFNGEDRQSQGQDLIGGLATCRTRTVTAGPKAINLIISSVMEPIRKGFEKRFAKTWKHNDIECQQEHVSKFKYFIGLDIKSYDQNLPLPLVEGVLSSFPVSDQFKRFIFISLLMPLYCADVDGKGTSMCSSDPLNNIRFCWRGLNSGHALTSAFGKYPVMVVLYHIFKKAGFLAGNSLEDFLDWKTDICVSNMSDDNKVYTNNKDVIDFIKKGGLDNPWLTFEIESGISYVGLLTYKDVETGQFRVTYNLASYVSKLFCPEKNIKSKLKPFGVYGRLQCMGPNMYGHHPRFSELNEVVRDTFKSHFGVDLIDLLKRNLEVPQNSDASAADIEVMIDPDKLEYKYDAEDIDSTLVSEIYTEIPDNILEKFYHLREL